MRVCFQFINFLKLGTTQRTKAVDLLDMLFKSACCIILFAAGLLYLAFNESWAAGTSDEIMNWITLQLGARLPTALLTVSTFLNQTV